MLTLMKMKMMSGFRRDQRASVVVQLRRLRKDERGAVSIMMGFLMVPLVGFVALGFEVSNWYSITRGMQNAADAAAIAAAINNGANYDVEARAVAAQYGFTNGVNNVLVGVSNTAACPITGDLNCYSVTISGYTPLLMSQIVGFQGAGNINGSLQKQLGSFAVAKAASPADICLLALASSHTSPAIHTNGAPTANLNGCNSMSYTGADCNGHNLGIGISFTVGSTNSGCGAKQLTNQPQLQPPDPYRSQITTNISNFPATDPCGGNYPQETHHGNSSSGGTSRSGPISLPAGNTFWCGDQRLTNDVTIDTPPTGGAVLVIINGQLDLNQNTFKTDTPCSPPAGPASCSSGLTIVFTSTPPDNGYIHAPTDNTNGPGGVLDITPPTTGPWAGIAIVQDPNLTTGVDIASAGNSPTWNITGLIYTPHATITLKGAIDKSTNGAKCVVMVADNFQISGTGGILKSDIGNCKGAGLKIPQVNVGAVALVL
jgi:Flp pilus assembly protein TadG